MVSGEVSEWFRLIGAGLCGIGHMVEKAAQRFIQRRDNLIDLSNHQLPLTPVKLC